MRLAAGTPVTVRLIKHPRPDVAYPGVVLFDDGSHLVVRAPWNDPERDLGYVRFGPGDVFIEHYWRDRWYSIKEVHAADGALKGWYCDVTRPVQVRPHGLVVTDLDLDLWRSADGRTVARLDEDEFRASGLTESDPEAAAQALAALDELAALARVGFEPVLATG
jgi:hypothetical protein